MALQVSGTDFGLFHRRSGLRIRAVASESVTTSRAEEEKVKLGGSDVKVTKLGIGAWAWGDTSYWNDSQWDDRKLKAAKTAFDASIDGGITFFDTAEVYGAGITGAINSETLLGRFIKERQEKDPVEVAIATKFAALPWRFGRGSVLSALKDSLSRFNPNFNVRNTNLGNLNGANPNNFYALNPNLQPMAQNNQLGVLQLLAAQLQSNPQLQINLLNQLQTQNFAAPFQQGGMPFMMGHNPNQMMMGMPNGQFLAQHQMLQGSQMMGPNNMGLGFVKAPGTMGQNSVYGSPVAVANPNQPQMSSSPMNTQWNKNAQQANGTQKFQVNHAEAKITDNSHVNARNSASRGSARNFGFGKEPSHNRFQKSQLHDVRGSKRNMKQFNRRGGRGEHNWREQKSHSIDSGEETPTVSQRLLPINYTKTEIQQWREARKKNFPTNKKKATVSENNKDADARLRCQQLKEVLAKQAELGVEVAEVPSSYLCEPEDLVPKKENEREATCGPSANKFNKKRGRGRGRDNWRFKRPEFNNKGAPTSPPCVKREPSLLEKLLSSDVKRDKSRLLQVFRFMVLNNFFKQLPGKPLEFPVVIVNDDGGCGSKIIREANPSLDGADSPADEAIEKALAEGIGSKQESCVAEEMKDEYDEEDTVGTGEQFEESEEGEITD